MKWQRFFLLVLLIPFLLLGEQYQEKYDQALAEWKKYEDTRKEYQKLFREQFDERLRCLEEIMACCKTGIGYCEEVLHEVNKKIADESLKNPKKMDIQAIKELKRIEEKWRSLRTRFQTELDRFQPFITTLQARQNALYKYQEVNEKVTLAHSKRQNCPRSLSNVDEVVQALKEAVTLYKEAARLIDEILSESRLSFSPEDTQKLKEEKLVFLKYAQEAAQEVLDWPVEIAKQITILQQRWAVLKKDSQILAEKGLKRSCYELQKQSLPILDQLIASSAGEQQQAYSLELEVMKGAVALFEQEWGENRLSEFPSSISPEGRQAKDEERTQLFYQQQANGELPHLLSSEKFFNTQPLDGQGFGEDEVFELYAEQFYRFLVPFKNAPEALHVQVYDSGKFLYEEKIDLPFENPVGWECFLKEGLIFVPQTNLQRDFGLALRLSQVVDSQGNHGLLIAQKSEKTGYEYVFSLDGKIILYACRFLSPPPSPLQSLGKQVTSSFEKPFEKSWSELGLTFSHPIEAQRALLIYQKSPTLDALVKQFKKNPLAIAQYVHNEIALHELYLQQGENGVVSASPICRSEEMTYLEKQGSAWEQCSLLVYLLRKAGYQTLYALSDGYDVPRAFVEKTLLAKLPEGQSEMKVSFPYVVFFDGKRWIPLYPWLKEVQVQEGYDLYNCFPEKYASADRWILHYLRGDEEILKYIGPDADDTLGVLFVRFTEDVLRKKGLSLNDVGLHRKPLKRAFSSWEEFPRPSKVSFNRAVFFPDDVFFNRISLEVRSQENPHKKLSYALKLAELDKGLSSIRFDYQDENHQKLYVQLGGDLGEKTLDLDASDRLIDICLKISDVKGTRQSEHIFSIAKGTTAALCHHYGGANSKISSIFYQQFATEENPNKRLATLLAFVGASYFEKCSRAQKKLAELHKIKPQMAFSFGLAKLSPNPSKGVFKGQEDLVFPQVDMVNFRASPDFSPDVSFKNDWQYNILATVDSSSNEHQILRDIFNDQYAVSTVKLLQLAHLNQQKNSRDGEGFLFFNSSMFEVADQTPEVAQTLYYSHIEGLNLRQVQALSPIQWQIIRTLLSSDNPYYQWTYVYMTPGLISSLDGSYSETGSLILSPHTFYAFISSNNLVMNGGLGSALPNDYLSYEAFQRWRLVSSSNSQGHVLDFGSASVKDVIGHTLISNDWKAEVRPEYQSDHNSVADPVDTISGAFYIDEIDLFLPGPFPLQVRRNYNSQNPLVGDFGCGWKLGFNPRLIEQDGKRFACESDGTVLVYALQEDTGRWQVLPADNPNLCHFPGRTNPFQNYIEGDTLYAPDGSRRFFKDGYLEKWLDAKDQALSFFYNEGRLERIESSSGDFLDFEYNPEEKVSQISANHVQTIFYEYNSVGDLTQVTLASGATIAYEYDYHHRVIRETKSGGRVLENLYDEQGRVIEQRSPMGYQQAMVVTASFEYQPDRTLVRDAAGSITTYQIFENQIYKVTDPLGNQSFQTWFLDENSYFDPIEERIVAWDQPGGSARGLKATIDKRGLTTTYLYDQRGNPIEISLLGDDLTGDGCSHLVKKLTYNERNLCIEEESGEQKSRTFYDEQFPYLPQRVEKYSGDTLISYAQWSYNDKGLIEKEDHSGSITLWQYDERGFPSQKEQLTGTEDAAVLTLYRYNDQGQCYWISTPQGIQEVDYDIMGNPIGSRLISHQSKLLEASYTHYDLHHQPIEKFSANEKNRCKLEYYPSGLLKAVHRQLAPTNKVAYSFYEYDARGYLTREVDPRGFVTKRKYDLLGKVVEETKMELTTRYDYEAGGLLETLTLPSGAQTRRLYTTNGLLKEEIYPDGTRNRFIYDAWGRPILETRNDISWQITYDDQHHRIIKMHVESGDREIQEFDARGNLIRLTDAAGYTLERTYDDLNRLTSETSPSGECTQWSYKNAGIICKHPSGEQTISLYRGDHIEEAITKDAQGKLLATYQYSYDPVEDLEVVVHGDQKTLTRKNIFGLPVSVQKGDLVTNYEYDACGHCVAYEDGDKKKTLQTYDGLGRLTSKTLPCGTLFTYAYDADSHLIAYHLPNGSTWEASYDGMGRKSSEKLTCGIQTSNCWDFVYEKGHLTQIKDPMGRRRQFLYDSYGRVAQETIGSWQRNYAYDVRGLLIRAEQSVSGLGQESSLVERSYDTDGRLSQEKIFLNGQLLQKSDQTWAPSSRLLQIDSHRREFTYQNQHLIKVATPDLALDYTYNLAGDLTVKHKPQTRLILDYHPSGLPKSATTHGFSTPWQEEMSWTPSGRLSSHSLQGQKRIFTYDARGQIQSAGQQSYEFDFGLPGIGVRTSAPGWSVPTTSGLDSFGRVVAELIEGQLVTNTYNAMGELTTQGSKSFEWDPWGRLLSVSSQDSTWSASYDALGRRLQTIYRLADQKPTISTSFYDPESEFLEIGVKINGKRFWKIYGSDGCEAIGDDAGNYATLLHQVTGELLGAVMGNKVHFVKGLPSIYGVYKTPDTPSDLITYAHSLSWHSLAQDPTGLIWMGARYYDPRSGRFISPDPIAHPFCTDLYTYANGDPINFRDPNGRFASKAYVTVKQTILNVLGDYRVQGVFQMIAGAAEISFSSGLILGGIGTGGSSAAVGCFFMAQGIDYISTGLDRFRGIERDTYISQGMQAMGVPRSIANVVDGALNVGPSLGTAQMARRACVAASSRNIAAYESSFISAELGLEESCRRYTRNNCRQHLIKEYGPSPGKNYDTHHRFPQKFEDRFIQKGINIHEPQYLDWWERSSHRSAARKYNMEWNEFFLEYPNATKAEILDKGNSMMREYIKNYRNGSK